MIRKPRLTALLRTTSIAADGCFPCIQPVYADSNGVVVESVNNFGGPGNLSNSIANGDGLLSGLVFPGSLFFQSARWTDGLVYDTDFVDPELNALGNDTGNFDKPGTAISYLTAHGIPDHGCSTVSCTTTAACTIPRQPPARASRDCRGPAASAPSTIPGAATWSIDRPSCTAMGTSSAVSSITRAARSAGVRVPSRAARRAPEPMAGRMSSSSTSVMAFCRPSGGRPIRKPPPGCNSS